MISPASANDDRHVMMQNNIWQHITYATDGTDSGEIYLDGELKFDDVVHSPIKDVAANGWHFNQEQDALDGGFDPNQAWQVKVAIIRLYNRKLSEQEIQQNWQAQKSRFGR